jgi:hypothetical protein
MGAPNSITLPRIVTPGETVDISVSLTAPETPGTYRGIWSFEDHTGKQFGLGLNGTGEIWVQVTVIDAPTSTPTLIPEPTQTASPTLAPPFISGAEILAYDFVSTACSAQWTSNDAALPCPAFDGEAQTSIGTPTLEDGSAPGYKAIRIRPGVANGTISGIYPDYLVQPGDHFRAIVSCELDAPACSALFRLSYQDASGTITDLWAVGEFQDRSYTEINVDLSTLAGQTVKLILNVTALNDDPNNNSFWVSPGIYRLPLPTATATPTATIVPTATSTVTATPTLSIPTPTPTPSPKAPPTIWEAIQQFIDDLFKSLFGG